MTKEQKKRSLIESIHEAARQVAENYFDGNTEDVDSIHLLLGGRVDPQWLDSGYCDQVSEFLYGDSQACDIEVDDDLFPEVEFKGKYGQGNMWNLLDKYFSDGEVDEIFYEEWNKLLIEKYGDNWRELK